MSLALPTGICHSQGEIVAESRCSIEWSEVAPEILMNAAFDTVGTSQEAVRDEPVSIFPGDGVQLDPRQVRVVAEANVLQHVLCLLPRSLIEQCLRSLGILEWSVHLKDFCDALAQDVDARN